MEIINVMWSQVSNSTDFIATLSLEPNFYEINVHTNIVTGERFVFSIEITEENWYRLFPTVLFIGQPIQYLSFGETLLTGTLPISKLIASCVSLVKGSKNYASPTSKL